MGLEDMTQHNHIDQRARLPEECPRCAVVWRALETEMYGLGQTIVITLDEEFATARSYKFDYGDDEAWTHLTKVRDSALIEKAQNTGLFQGR